MTPRHTTPAPVAFVPWVTVGGAGGPLPGRRQARRGRSGARRPARAGMDRGQPQRCQRTTISGRTRPTPCPS